MPTFIQHSVKLCLVAAVGLSVVACNDPAKNQNPQNPGDPTASAQDPVTTIRFPPARSLTGADRITVRGTTEHYEPGVTSVKVNGIEATTGDDFAQWSVEIPLSIGENTLSVSVVDGAGQVDGLADEAVVTHSPHSFSYARAVVWDSVNDRALVAEKPRTRTVKTPSA